MKKEKWEANYGKGYEEESEQEDREEYEWGWEEEEEAEDEETVYDEDGYEGEIGRGKGRGIQSGI